MQEAGDNIWVLNWYRLTKYPDQEERAAILSCLYTMSAPTAPSCTVTIWSILIQTSSLLGPKPHFQHSVLESSYACVSQRSLQMQRLVLSCNDYAGFILRYITKQWNRGLLISHRCTHERWGKQCRMVDTSKYFWKYLLEIVRPCGISKLHNTLICKPHLKKKSQASTDNIMPFSSNTLVTPKIN